jgi:hypothetical protein
MEFGRGGGVADTVVRRLGTAPAARGACSYSGDCPDVFELESGDFAIIGRDATGGIALPADAGCSAAERVVVVPRDVLLAAFADLSRGV